MDARHEDAPADLSVRGTNQKGVRAYNERLVLTLVRRQGPLAKAEIAKRTGLSPQTVSVIMRALEGEGLIAREAPVRGKVGQPSVPFSLAPDGALFFGLKIGRRSSELALIDFVGAERASRRVFYRYPTPDAVMNFVRGALEQILGGLDAASRDRIRGLGIAAPFELWRWPRLIGLPEGAMADWRHRDLRAEIADICDFPVHLENDGSAACSAELIFGTAPVPPAFLYAYVGYFIGGGIVLDGNLHTGAGGNAGALASMPVPAPGGGARQLIEPASIATLERRIEHASGGTPGFLTDDAPWEIPPGILDAWIAEAAEALAFCCIGAAALIEAPAVVIDGWLPTPLRSRLARATASAIAAGDTAGIAAPTVIEGTLGPRARSLGAAALVLSKRYMVDQTAIFR